VETNAPNASKFRVRYYDTTKSEAAIKAIGKILPGITTCEELQMIGYHPKYPANGNYPLGGDIPCEATNPSNWTNPEYANKLWQLGYAVRYGPNGFDGQPGGGDDSLPVASSVATALAVGNLGFYGFKPFGNSTTKFSGTFDGKSKIIKNLYINRPTEYYGALIGRAAKATILNVGLEGGSIISRGQAGSLAGDMEESSVTNCYATLSVASRDGVNTSRTGGLVGEIRASTIAYSHATGAVSGVADSRNLGGLVGTSNYVSRITDSYATGNVGGSQHATVGGLVGANIGSTIERSYATGTVQGYTQGGGLVGKSTSANGGTAQITDSYATGAVTLNLGTQAGGSSMGGLVGDNWGIITNCYAKGNVSGGTVSTGGLLGFHSGANITNSFAIGTATGTGKAVGGLVGWFSSGTLTNSWWFNGTNSKGVGVTGGSTLLDTPDPSGITKAALLNNFYGTGTVTGAKVYWTNGTVGGTAAWNFWSTTNPAGIWESVSGGLPRLKWES